MTLLYLVRHAKPAATWGEAIDPGLDDLGHTQSQQAANSLRELGRLAIYTSPLKRCRETANPLAAYWKTSAEVLAPVAEIPSPPLPLSEKQKWLHASMQGTWQQLQERAPANSPDFQAWRAELLRTLRNLKMDSIIFTHYVAINVAVGEAQGHDRVIAFRPGHASITVLAVEHGRIEIRELGKEATDSGILLGR